MELGVRVNGGSDHEAEDISLDGFEWPSVNIHGLKQARTTSRPDRFSVNPSDQPTPKPPVPDSDAIAEPLGMASANAISRAYLRSRHHS
jgi:hypothetical protein